MKSARHVSVFVSLLFVSLLSGCSTVTKVQDWMRGGGSQTMPAPPSPAIASTPPTPVPAPPKPKREPREQKEPAKTAAIDPSSLVGLDPPAVAKVLGPPSTVAKGDPSLVWSYVSSGCTFRVFFYPDLKTASFHALKFGGFDGNGEQIGLSQICIRNILTARANGSG